MNIRHFILGAAGAISLVAIAAAAQAGPLTGPIKQLPGGAASTTTVEKAAYRCRWRNGRRMCRWVSSGYGAYAFFGSPSAETLRAAASAVPNP